MLACAQSAIAQLLLFRTAARNNSDARALAHTCRSRQRATWAHALAELLARSVPAAGQSRPNLLEAVLVDVCLPP